MKGLACPFAVEIGRAARPETDPELAEHLDSCPICQAERREIQRAAVMLQALPYQPPDEDAREQARTRLVAALGARPPRPRPRRWLGRGAVLAASLCGSIVAAAVGTHVMQTRQEAPAFTPPEKIVRRPRPPRARPEPPPVVAPAPVVPPAPAPEPPRPAPVRPARKLAQAIVPLSPPPAAPRPAPGATPGERAFNEGWAALRAGDHLAAAAQMRRALELEPGNALAEDARYWRAVALGRAGAAGEAREAMEEFLRAHPRSPRAGEVSVMLAWLLVDAGEKARAESLFRAAGDDPRPQVRKSAAAGLKAVGPAGP